jgi:hypothetical protein
MSEIILEFRLSGGESMRLKVKIIQGAYGPGQLIEIDKGWRPVGVVPNPNITNTCIVVMVDDRKWWQFWRRRAV